MITTLQEILEFFLAIVRKMANYYPLVHDHIYSPLQKDVSYMSPTSQMN